MKLKCPRCGSENELDVKGEVDARPRACRSCGASLPARSAGEYDGYAVGRRVLRFAPAWLLLLFACFVAALLFFSWATRPIGRGAGAQEDEFRNEATNRPTAQASPTPAREESKGDARSREELKGEARSREDSGGAGGRPLGDEGEVPAAGTESGEAGGANQSEESASFSVQVGAFDDRSQANEQVSRVRAAGFDARVVEAEDARRFRFQVRSGVFPTREDAARLAARLRSKGVGRTVIVEPSQK